jgi:capsular polysaccharide export protein
MLVDRRITKYNLAENAVTLDVPEGRRRILVPGQFEDDKSVLLGGAGITTNEELLRRVRAANPEAFIVYKPHPDVESGHRKGIIANELMTRLADAVVRRTAILSLIEWADEVHTLTSQTGFEALLRDRKVVTYGQPYYAGWGLTVDANPVARRQRRLSLAELIAGTLILYPRYVDPVTRLPCGPEVVIDRIADPNTRDRSQLSRLREVQGMVFALAKDWTRRLMPRGRM